MNEILKLIIDNVLTMPAHEKIVIHENHIPHPKNMGFREDIGAPVGQSEDYRLALKDGKSIHAQKHGCKWHLHWDKLDPVIDKIEHLRVDAPGYYTLATTCVGAGVGAIIGNGLGTLSESEDGTTDGALIGIAIGSAIGAIAGILNAEWD